MCIELRNGVIMKYFNIVKLITFQEEVRFHKKLQQIHSNLEIRQCVNAIIMN